MPYKKKTSKSRRKCDSRRRVRTQKKQMKMHGGVDTPLFGDETMTIPMDPTENNILDDSDITPPFTPPTDYGETTQESISTSDADISLGFGGRKRRTRRTRTRRTRTKRRRRGRSRRRQKAGGFTITEDTSPESYDDDYENNLANIEEVMLSS
jgi:hypothetical protein